MGFLNKEFASSPPSDKHPRQKRKARVEGRGGEIRERTATTVERAASQFNHGDNRNNGFAYHRIYPLRLYIAALRGGALKRTARVQCRANTRDGSTVSLQNDRQDFLQIPCVRTCCNLITSLYTSFHWIFRVSRSTFSIIITPG